MTITPRNLRNYDAMFSYSNHDWDEVERIARTLKNQWNISIWIDKWELRPGTKFLNEIPKGIQCSKSLVVFIGEGEISDWQLGEISTAMDQKLPIIPVILPNVNESHLNGGFLKQFTFVKFGGSFNDGEAIQKLVWGITGVNPQEKQVFG